MTKRIEKQKRRSGRSTDMDTAEIIPLYKIKYSAERTPAPIRPLNAAQAEYLDALRASPQVIVLGPAGTGKTWIAATYAADLYRARQVGKIILTRPNVPCGRSLGFFPGSLEEKFAPWAAPVVEAIRERIGVGAFDIALKRGEIEMVPFEVMRGRSWNDAFVLLDEAQNTTPAVLSVLQVIWVNTHIFFMMGPILTALFWRQARGNGQSQQADVLQRIFWLLLGMCLINPSGINGFLVPFGIDKAYSYMITENRSVFHYLNLKMMPDKSRYLYFLTTLGMLMVPLFFLIQREGLKKYILPGTLTLLLSIAALTAVRMIGLYGFFWIPLSSYVYSKWMGSESVQFRKNIEIVLVAAGVLVSSSVNLDWEQRHGLGVVPGINDAAEFFKREKISGPIFNNYNIGGYLIFHLSPEHKFFVDNRMEAFPKDFFKRTYVPMQLNNDRWHAMDQRYHFNAIFYSPESTPWGSGFLMDRYTDPSWAVVFYSKEAVIFLKRNEQNAPFIRRFGKHVNIIDPPAKIEHRTT